jgi:hypothetical protein
MKNITAYRKVWTFYKWVLFLLFLQSLLAWFFWDIGPNQFIIPILFIFISVGIFVIYPQMFSFKRETTIIIILLYLLTRFLGTRGNVNAYLGMIITSAGVLFFAGLKDRLKIDFLDFFTKAFAILMAVSLFAWFIFLLGVELPSFPDSYGYSEIRDEAGALFQNYYFFILNVTFPSDLILPRFSSVFGEPGYLGILLVLILFLNNFNLKNKYNIVLLVALFSTFSLAGWLLGTFAYVSYLMKNSKKRITSIILIFIGGWAFYAFYSNYNNGNNMVNEAIFDRLQYDETRGNISGYNRTSQDFDWWFAHNFIRSSDILFGIDMYQVFGETANVGWKAYITNYGLIGLAAYLLFLYYIFHKNKNYLTLIFLLLYILTFARGHHVIFMFAFPATYLCGSVSLKANQTIKYRTIATYS